jgi:hypothetical protein
MKLAVLADSLTPVSSSVRLLLICSAGSFQEVVATKSSDKKYAKEISD